TLACAASCGGFDESGCSRCGDGACTAAEDAASCAEDCFVPGLAFLNNAGELIVTDLAGTTVSLSGPLVAGGAVHDYRWSPDRKWIAFVADKETAGVDKLYVVPARGGAPVEVSPSAIIPKDG